MKVPFRGARGGAATKSSAPRLADDLAAHLRSRLISGTYAPDDVLAESGIASEYGVARPTARAAIDALVADGLLVHEAHLPARVARIGHRDLLEIVELVDVSERMSIERLFSLPQSARDAVANSASSAHNLLNAIVVASSSERLALIHRRSTFELLLGCRQHGVDDLSTLTVSEHDVLTALEEAISSADVAGANAALRRLQSIRRAPVENYVHAAGVQHV